MTQATRLPGTCAGLIMLADMVIGGVPGQHALGAST